MTETSAPAVSGRGADAVRADEGPFLRLTSVGKSFGQNVVLESISIDIARGEFLTLLGESGSGKTTLLRILAGLEEATSGEISLNGFPLQPIPAHRRPINTVFQSYALFPHMTVFENVAYGLRVRGCDKHEIKERVVTSLKMVKMEKFEQYAPRQISGGQKQRVALARALVNKPEVLLLDEPLSALDANLRGEMQRELKLLQEQLGITFLFVTHDQEEAMAMSDRIVLLSRGRIEQCGTPRQIYLSPRTPYAASFLGKSNVLHGTVKEGLASCGPFQFRVADAEGMVAYSLRPECVRMAAASSLESSLLESSLHFEAKVEMQHFEGAQVLLTLRCVDGTLLRARLPTTVTLTTHDSEIFICDRADFVRLELT